jgi:hypothetical protein
MRPTLNSEIEQVKQEMQAKKLDVGWAKFENKLHQDAVRNSAAVDPDSIEVVIRPSFKARD